jgi:plastocyanin
MGRRRADLGWVATTAVITAIAGCGSGGGGGAATGVPTGAAPAGPATLSANAGGADAAHPERDVLAFYPATLSAHAGTLRMVNPTRWTPHTVPSGCCPGGEYSSGLAVSGSSGGRPLPASGYSLRFTAAGTYPSTCPIHPGMAGVVEVR